jgi:hypothetical protein
VKAWRQYGPLKLERYRADDFSLLVRFRRLLVKRGRTVLIH